MSTSEISNGADWQKANAQYLSAAMTWLHTCLEQCVAHQSEKLAALALPTVSVPERQKSRWRFLGSPAEVRTTTPNLLLPPATAQDDQRVAQAATAMEAAANEMDPPPALLILTERL